MLEKITQYQPIIIITIALIISIIGGIIFTAIVQQYNGLIEIQLDPNGVKVIIDGRK